MLHKLMRSGLIFYRLAILHPSEIDLVSIEWKHHQPNRSLTDLAHHLMKLPDQREPGLA